MTAPLIGLIGKKRSGKDSFAAALTGELGYRRVAFADGMKRSMLRLNPWVPTDPHRLGGPVYERLSDVVTVYGWEEAKGIPEVRRLLQEHGTAIRDVLGPDVWIDAVFETIANHRSEGTPIVVTDVRFPNEATCIRRNGGHLVRITRPGLVSTDQHISETALDDFAADFQVMNAGTLGQLRAQAKRVTYEVELRLAGLA